MRFARAHLSWLPEGAMVVHEIARFRDKLYKKPIVYNKYILKQFTSNISDEKRWATLVNQPTKFAIN